MGDIITKTTGGIVITRPGTVTVNQGATPREPAAAHQATKKTDLRVLFVSSNCQGVSLAVDREFNRVQERIVNIDPEWARCLEHWPDASLHDLATRLHRAPGPIILHFAGHGDPKGGILLRDHNGDPTYMDGLGVSRLLGAFSSKVRLVVLNACYSAALGERLVESIGLVIGMQHPIDDDTSILFAQSFYEALAAKCHVQRAFDIAAAQATARLADVENVPKLLTRSDLDPAQLFFTATTR